MENPYRPNPTIIIKTIDENDAKDIRTFRLKFSDPEAREAFSFRAGQFAELSLFGVGECPIGIASSPMEKEYVEFTVKRMGVMTTALHSLETGDYVGVRGPYGNGFPLEMMEGTNIVVVAGGFAFTTLRSLTNYILHPDNRERFGTVTVIYGARNPGELIYKYDLDRWATRKDLQLHVTVDAGDDEWTGLVGYVPSVLKDVSPKADNAVAAVCGPPIMIRFSLPVLSELGFPPSHILNSLEMRMKCGMGKCGRCNVGPYYVCKDGPVFTLEQLQNVPGEY